MIISHSFIPNTEACGLITTATLGTFDGVHMGHRKLIGRLVEIAHRTGTESAILTFDAHPLTVIQPDIAPKVLTTLDEKLFYFETMGVDRVFVLKFTDEIAGMSSGTFIERYLVHCLGITYFIVGYDHHFGNDKLRSEEKLRSSANMFDFKIEIMPPVLVDGETVKSSAIREYITAGAMRHAAMLLGYPYSFVGTVKKGRGMGRKLGFPTANIAMNDQHKCIPGNGVYVGFVELADSRYDAVITVGPIPTFDLKQHLIEVHIPGFESDIYGQEIRVGFNDRLRDIKHFKTERDLIKQIENDIIEANRVIQNNIYS